MGDTGSPPSVLIVGGGVAALETMMALHDLSGPRVRVTLVTPESNFVYRPLSVAEPFGLGQAGRFPLEQIGEDFGAEVLQAGVTGIDAVARHIVLSGGETLPYDGALVLTLGARIEPAFEGVLTFAGSSNVKEMRDLVDELEVRQVSRIAFIAPEVTGWTLPLYELALLTARHAAARDLDPELVLITPEPKPLAVFGDEGSDSVADLLSVAGIEFVGGTTASVEGGTITLDRGGRTMRAERIVALPLVRGPKLDGVPADPETGFIPVDEHGRVEGLEGVYAAGDATNFPIKQGGLAAQQADAVAEHIAATHGALVDPSPFRPVVRGMLFNGDVQEFMWVRGRGVGHAAKRPLWWPPTKIAGRYLAPYLYEREPNAVPADTPEGFVELEVSLEPAR